jgi:hypothetical protein
MADVLRVSGSRIVTQNGPATIASPVGIVLNSTNTNITGQLVVANNTEVSGIVRLRTEASQLKVDGTANVLNPFGFAYDPNNIYGDTNQRLNASAYFSGGVGIEKDLNVGGWIYGRVSIANTSQQLIVTATNVDSIFYPTFTDRLGQGTYLYGDDTGQIGGLTYNPSQGKLVTDRMRIASGDTSASPATGALTVAGGAGIGGNVNVGGYMHVAADISGTDITPNADNQYQIGTENLRWSEAYLENIYTRVIASTTGTVQIDPAAGLTEVVGDIRVLGQKPIGTAPVVTNTLYVTVDGNDTNDGRAQDASRACRTIGGALNSPYYQPGTQILVSAGHYLEDNPLRMKPYTSIRGSDIRTTFIEPINKTQDLFHLESGCYLNYMTFLNGRSGLLDGPYAAGFNRGAYATAFPPLSGNEKIDLFHSPYVQNCTNQSGPWLKDGTMFVPSQTVQVPVAVGTGTWLAGTATIVVTTSSGEITRGMTINTGQQNPGFFNARTLLLANKPFLQEQVVEYVNQTFPGFEYSREKCFRDVGILVENVAYDAAFGGNQKAVESGLAYYDGVVSLIEGQQTQTTAAIDYLNSLTQSIIVNAGVPDLFFNGSFSTATHQQVVNIVLTGGEIAQSSVDSLFTVITDIITDGPAVAPAVYTSTGPDAAYVSAEILMQANRAFIQQDTINWINNTFLAFPYSEVKCRRDTGLIIDSIAFDLLYPTADHSQSTFAGLQYWNQNSLVSGILDEITTTTNAVRYLKDLAIKIIQNITPADDLIDRYQLAVSQDTSLEPATEDEVNLISDNFDIMLEILSGNKTGWTDRIVTNGSADNALPSIKNAYALLLANLQYMQYEVTAYIDETNIGFSYDANVCRRDIGYIVNAIAFDLLHGGNRQSIQSALYYYGFSGNTAIHNQNTQTVAAFNYLATLAGQVIQNQVVTPLQTAVGQVFTTNTATSAEADLITESISTITGIIINGAGVAAVSEGIALTSNSTTSIVSAFNNLYANKDFLKEEVIAYIDQTYNPTSFNYDEAKCYRDVGLIVDAVSQDILLGGNQKSIEAGLAYWSAGYNYITGQETTTTMAINHARDIALQIIANDPVTVQTGTIIEQVINPYFQYGGDYMPQQAVSRNFGIITNIIERGPIYAPPVYAGGGIFALTGLNGADVKIAPKVTSVVEVTTGTYRIGLSTSTIGFGNNATLYFGETATFPKTDAEVEEASFEYTGSTGTWDQRKLDPIGSMGGSLVDGAVISARSPIQSFVYDAFTQVNQGGRGIHITNDGYAQLVSVFTIFCSVGVQTDNGGIASIVNSNANFGDICLLAKGYGKRKFSGTVYNPVFKAYPDSPGVDGLNQYYPNGFWPNNARVQIFLPDVDDRAHISLVMEIEPPPGHVNEQALPGFLNAQPSKGVLNTGTIIINDVDTTGIAIGNNLYIRDQFGSFTGTNNLQYAAADTIVTDLGYRSITLNRALESGGGDPDNNNFFNLYFCGNSYYTVLSSEVATNPKPEGVNILSTASTGLAQEQITAHVDSLTYMNYLVTQIINNTAISGIQGDVNQTILPLVTGGGAAQTFIDLRFGEMIDIIEAADITAAEAVIPMKLRTKTGPAVQGASSAITLIEANLDYFVAEINAYITISHPEVAGYDIDKCSRDVKLILRRLIYDIQTGGRYNSVMNGLSYWSRNGTHHLVQLGENVRRTDLFPDGSNVNFYQRSYMSASGYVFEYVGAGTNYAALPQVGRADPVQGKETVQLNSGKVFFTSTDQNGDFRIGPGLVISQATGVLSGRTFTKSLFANMTPFILAIESGSL